MYTHTHTHIHNYIHTCIRTQTSYTITHTFIQRGAAKGDVAGSRARTPHVRVCMGIVLVTRDLSYAG